MHGLDRRLDLIRPGLVALEAFSDDRLAFGDEAAIPEAAVLVGQKHKVAVRVGSSGPTRLDEQHQREQPLDLRFVGHQLGQQPSEADGLAAEVLSDQSVARARRVALVEDQVNDGQHGATAAREVGLAGDPVRDPRVANFSLGADEALGHGRFRYQEGARDLSRGQPAEQPERERNLNVRRERGVAAGEDQAELIVAHSALLRRLAAGVQPRGRAVPSPAGPLAPEALARAVASGGNDPSRRAGRQSGRRPPLHRCRERVLDGLLGNVDVAEDPNKDGDGSTVLLAEYMFNLGGCEARRAWYQSSASSWNGRTSIGSGIARASF